MLVIIRKNSHRNVENFQTYNLSSKQSNPQQTPQPPMAKTTQNHPTPRQPHLPTQPPRMHHHSNRNRPHHQPPSRRHQPPKQPPSRLHHMPQTKNTTRIPHRKNTTQTQTQTTPTRHPHHQQNLTTPPPTTNNNTNTQQHRQPDPRGGTLRHVCQAPPPSWLPLSRARTSPRKPSTPP